MGETPLSEQEQAFVEELFTENYKILYARAYELLRNIDPAAADDCLGNLFLTLCLCCKRVISHENPKAWLFLTLKFICLKHIRNIGNRSKHTVPLDETIANGTPDGENIEDIIVNDILFCQWENQNLREKLISQLNKNEQKILSLRFKQGLSNKEIADILGKSEDAVRFTIYYIKKKITEKIYSL